MKNGQSFREREREGGVRKRERERAFFFSFFLTSSLADRYCLRILEESFD
jgi:hypothetical protein